MNEYAPLDRSQIVLERVNMDDFLEVTAEEVLTNQFLRMTFQQKF